MKRYDFGGFVFGSNESFQLTVRVPKEFVGYTVGIELELTTEERLELINLLTTMNKKEDN